MNEIYNRNRGYSGDRYDRFVERCDNSTLSRVQQQYWEMKQTFLRKIKKKEDDCIVASDAELDAKLELFNAIDETCQNLIFVLEGYQDNTCGLAHEENATGRFLKDCGKIDKTRAGKMMTATGKTLCYTAQQRVQLRNPLVRLNQEVETFQYRAVADTLTTIDKMEKARTAYRGALLWMKDASQQLDPDTYKQLEKFRKIQSHVRRTKSRFDKLKLDTLQKIDLLSASRCNMLSHALVGYQTALLQFWEKTSRTMNAVSESFKGYQYYEFNMLRELTETSKKLAEVSGDCEDLRKIFEEVDDDDKDKLLFFESDYHDNERSKKKDSKQTNQTKRKSEKSKSLNQSNIAKPKNQVEDDFLVDLNLHGLAGKIDTQATLEHKNNKEQLKDILTASDLEADDLTLLNEILNMPTAPVIETSQAVETRTEAYMPSQLLELNESLFTMQLNSLELKEPKEKQEIQSQKQAQEQDTQKKNRIKPKNQDMSPWFKLFADLDPLANPDLIDKKSDEKDDRNC